MKQKNKYNVTNEMLESYQLGFKCLIIALIIFLITGIIWIINNSVL